MLDQASGGSPAVGQSHGREEGKSSGSKNYNDQGMRQRYDRVVAQGEGKFCWVECPMSQCKEGPRREEEDARRHRAVSRLTHSKEI
jgi:hypothetical protein